MAIVSMMRFPGDPDELAARMREHLEPVADLAASHGGLGSIVAKTDDGLLVINLWANEEGRHAMAEEPAVKEALQNAGFGPPAFEGFEVLDYTIRQEAVTE